jgi:hypothetical protein
MQVQDYDAEAALDWEIIPNMDSLKVSSLCHEESGEGGS